MGSADIVREYYNQNPQIEWDRLEGGKPEFEITMRHLKENLKLNSKILDVGGGPGRYAFSLTELGHKVTLFDLSEGNIEFAKKMNLKNLGFLLIIIYAEMPHSFRITYLINMTLFYV